MYKILDGNKNCALSAYNLSEVACIYPITPSSPMANWFDVASNHDEKNFFGDAVKLVEMQSEAGAIAAVHGALLTGSLATTFTSSQGLLLMIPNMYKIAGECLPAVIHVAARTVATHALSIFGDHSDIYAVRQTGFCMLASTSVRDTGIMSYIAHLSAIKGSLPFVNFFDGFRTSHEVNKVPVLNKEDVLKLVDMDAIKDFKSRMLIQNVKQRGLAENEDIYFQSVEARNKMYDEMPDIVASYMDKINEIAGTNYKPFNYYGSPSAKNVIVAMGSVCDTIKLVVDKLNNLGEDVGLIEVHLYRPFSKKYLLNVLPNTVENIAVLDRTKESGSIGEPLYLDVLSALNGKGINIVGGRYGLSSKNTTPSDINAVFNMLKTNLKNNFTISIIDDVTNLSLERVPIEIENNYKELKIYGFASDGMVSASKDIMNIVGENYFVQSYNQYDSKKSGGVTISNLRISDKEINAPFYVTNPDIVVITKDEYVYKYEMINDIKENGIVLLNTSKKKEELNGFLPSTFKEILNNKKINFYIINADEIASTSGIKGKINKIMETIILKLLNVPNYMEILEESIKLNFKSLGEDVINANINAIKNSISNLIFIDNELTYVKEELKEESIIEKINLRKGDTLKVSDLLKYKDGSFECNLASKEHRKTSTFVPKWIPENCIQCGRCFLVCPHGVIRPFIVPRGEGNLPLIGSDAYDYEIKISSPDCTSCGLCINACLGKMGNKALEFAPIDEIKYQEAIKYFENHENPEIYNRFSVKGSQLVRPRFAFSGACAGCGETPYIKLLTQLYKDNLIIANATGCSSIYGGSAPSTPYSVSWANSLFEDNAEFGYGMLISYENNRKKLINYVKENINEVDSNVSSLLNDWINNLNDEDKTIEIKKSLENLNIPNKLKEMLDYIPFKSIWAIGGDGWAYDIGASGLDHVLSSNANINILVLDTEVYSNTGGQASKSSRVGAVAQFADDGKKTNKKDLFKIAMSYPNCYVASVSFGANFEQTIKAMKEAVDHVGPSIIIAYSPCIEQGIKGGMSNSTLEQKKVVECGYVTLMRYKPENDELIIDSKEPNFDLYDDLLNNENRYRSLKTKNPEKYVELLKINKENAINKYEYYKKLSERK